MPQLVPFQFVNSIITLIIALSFIVWFLSVVVLPIFPRLFVSRLFVTTL